MENLEGLILIRTQMDYTIRESEIGIASCSNNKPFIFFADRIIFVKSFLPILEIAD